MRLTEITKAFVQLITDKPLSEGILNAKLYVSQRIILTIL